LKLIGKIVPYWFAVLGLLALLSCAESIISMRDLTALRKGMRPDEAITDMGVSPKEVFQWSMAKTGDTIIVQSYFLSAGDYSTTYFLAYRNDALIFWGSPQEFTRSSNPLLREIGKEAIKRESRYRGDWVNTDRLIPGIPVRRLEIFVEEPYSYIPKWAWMTHTLPPGVYRPKFDDNQGVYFQAPDHIVLGLTNLRNGGIYLKFDAIDQPCLYIIIDDSAVTLKLPPDFELHLREAQK
jgi:hypothetical protein